MGGRSKEGERRRGKGTRAPDSLSLTATLVVPRAVVDTVRRSLVIVKVLLSCWDRYVSTALWSQKPSIRAWRGGGMMEGGGVAGGRGRGIHLQSSGPHVKLSAVLADNIQ